MAVYLSRKGLEKQRGTRSDVLEGDSTRLPAWLGHEHGHGTVGSTCPDGPSPGKESSHKFSLSFRLLSSNTGITFMITEKAISFPVLSKPQEASIW